MEISDRICKEVKDLPEQLQAEVLDYVHFPAAKRERESLPDEQAMKSLSISPAMRGMEDEVSPDYFISDLTTVV